MTSKIQMTHLGLFPLVLQFVPPCCMAGTLAIQTYSAGVKTISTAQPFCVAQELLLPSIPKGRQTQSLDEGKPEQNQMRIAMPFVGGQVIHVTVPCTGWLYEKTVNFRDVRIHFGSQAVYRNLHYATREKPLSIREHMHMRLDHCRHDAEGKRVALAVTAMITQEFQNGMIMTEATLPCGTLVKDYRPSAITEEVEDKSMII